MPAAAFWRAWSIWAVTVAATATMLAYTAVHPLPAKLADQGPNGLNVSLVIVFIAAFATVGALLAWKRPGNPIGWLLSASGLAYAAAGFGAFLAHFPADAAPGPLAGFPVLPGHRVVRVRRAAVPLRRSALPPLAAGGLGRRGGPGRMGPGHRVRPHAHLGRPAGPEPGRRDRGARKTLHGHGGRRRRADRRHWPGRRGVPGVPLPARRDGRACPAEMAGLRGRRDRSGRARLGAGRIQQPAERD